MEAYKLDISEYVPEIPGVPEPEPYVVRDVLAAAITSPRLGLNPADLLKNHVLAVKILQEKDNTILLAADEYHTIRNATDTLTNWSMPDVQFLLRIRDCERVEVEEVER